MKVKAGVSQLEEAEALPASVNHLCFDIGALGNFVHGFWAIKSTMKEGLGSSHLLSPIKLQVICRAAAVAAPALDNTTFGQNGTTSQELLELILSSQWRKELRGLSSFWRTYCLQLQYELREPALK